MTTAQEHDHAEAAGHDEHGDRDIAPIRPLNRPKPVDRDMIDKLLSAISSPRDRVLLILYLATGLRLSEMAQLDRSTIIIEEHTGNWLHTTNTTFGSQQTPTQPFLSISLVMAACRLRLS